MNDGPSEYSHLYLGRSHDAMVTPLLLHTPFGGERPFSTKTVCQIFFTESGLASCRG